MTNKFVKYIFVISLVFSINLLFAQNQNLLKNFLTVEEGLSHNEVTSIVQDNDGFIWIGTRGGLNRYDGYEFKIFNQVPGDSNSLVNPSIESLFVDSKGNIWIGSKSGGVSKYNPVTGAFKNIISNYKKQSELLPDNRVLCFHEDKKGRIWMGTWENGVIVFDEQNNTSKRYLTGLVNSIKETAEGKIWVGSSTNLFEYIETGDTLKLHDAGSVEEIWYDENLNALWLVQGNVQGFRKFDLRNHEVKKYRVHQSIPELPDLNYPFESILIDSRDNIWIGTWGTGLFLFNKEAEQFSQFQIYPENRGTFNKDYDAILDIFEDADGNIWIGTNGGGVCVLTPKLKFNSVGFHPEKNKGLKNTRIMTVVEDKNNNLWLGTIGSGLIWSPDKINFYPVDYPEEIDPSGFFVVKNLFVDNNNTVWVGTGPGTYFIRFENGVPKMKDTKTNLQTIFPAQAVSFLDAHEMFWVGSLQNGLFLYDKNNNYRLVKQLNKMNKSSGDLFSDRISDLLLDSKGRVWLGTYNGLHIFNPEDTTVSLVENKLNIQGEFTGNIITSLEADQKGNIWIGTPNGLNRLSEIGVNHFKVDYFTEDNGLASNFVKGISHDQNGNIWLSTNIGISKFETKNLRFINFNETDGVNGKNFTEASVFRNPKSGEIFFGGTQGLTWFNPDEIIEHSQSPKPVFTGLRVLNKNVEAGQEIDSKKILNKSITHTARLDLSFHQNNFEVEFSALNYKSLGRSHYEYFLENHDKDWNKIGNRRFVYFNNLRPGEYKLLVKSLNSHNVRNDDAAELIIRIHPPFWQAWYALVFYILVIVGLVTIIRWNAVKQVRLTNNLEMEKVQHDQDQKLNELKLRFFTNLSHEFRTPLTLILAPLKELMGKAEKFDLSLEAQNKIGIIQKNSIRLMKLVNQLLDFRKVESGNMKLSASKTNFGEFVAEICHPFFELAQINNIKFKVNTKLKTQNIWIDRDKMEIILNNLISNAFKNVDEKGKIEVDLFEEEDEVLISVSDNGPGIPKTEIDNIFDRFYRVGKVENYGSSGIGLALVKRFTELHKGNISVVSEQNVLTQFTVSLPKGIKHLKQDDIVDIEVNDIGFTRKEQIFSGILPVKEKQKEKSGECILIVEDNQEVNDYLFHLLEPLYFVEIAKNGAEGFDIATQKIPDLIISDVMMPKIDGFELCKKIRENKATSTIPFIFLTAKSNEQCKLLGTQLGADDFISKPFDPNLLLEKVKNILASRKKLQKQYSRSIWLEPSDIEITSSDEIFIEKTISIIEKNLQNHNFSSEVLASELNMSNSSLYRKLKSLIDTSTAEFIRSIRIKRAAQLLANKEKTITEIAYEVGFNDVKHFRTVFQKQFACSPSEYRGKLLIP